ncbi:MAG: crotonase/enoyl-CoA hydratase family protein [Rhodospirillales bacterium]|nr:crotonase/enoyl-CoA hydratase family protein [Rhodospirillales bacterium]
MSYVAMTPASRTASADTVVAPMNGESSDIPGSDLLAFLSGRPAGSEAGAGLDFPASTADVFTLNNLRVTFDRNQRILWWSMTPRKRPSFTPGLLADMKTLADALECVFASSRQGRPPVNHLVLSSQLTGIFNLGGDLSLFLDRIERRDRDALVRYAHACTEGQYRIATNFGLPISTIALVQGDALGGGFEAALANDVIIAERSAKFGLPEVLFNLFPGMGAYSFLSRRLGAAQAERMILSGRVYSADELCEMGVVDLVVDDARGPAAIYEHVAAFERKGLARQAMLQTRRIVNPVSREELMQVVDVWVDTALMLSSRDLRRMRHLALAQDRRWSTLAAGSVAANA